MVDFTNPQVALNGAEPTVPSSSSNPLGALWLIPGLVGAFLLGFVYTWVMKIPFVYIDFIMTIVYGFVAAFIVSRIYSSMRMACAPVILVMALAFAVVINYANWFWFVFDKLEMGEFIWHPSGLLDVINEIADRRTITLGRHPSGSEISGDGLRCLYVAEACLLAGSLFYSLRMLRKAEYFCPICKAWTSQQLKVTGLLLNKELYARVAEGDVTVVGEIPKREGNGTHNVVFTVCPTCGSARIYVEEVKIGKKGEVSMNELSEYPRCELTPDGVEKLLAQFNARQQSAGESETIPFGNGG